MTRQVPAAKIVKMSNKGQITVPAEFRRAFGIKSEPSYVSVELDGDCIVITPFRQGQESLRDYTDEEIARFLDEDKLAPEVAASVRDLLAKGDL